MEQQTTGTSTSGKKSTWQWIVLCVVIVAVLGGVTYFASRHQKNQSSSSDMNAMTAKPTAPMQQAENTVYKVMSKGSVGMVMTDTKGMTLYTYAKDTSGVSNCTGPCLKVWPVYVAPSQSGSFPDNISVITRSDGTLQYAWKGMPLYYFAKDGDSGDMYGNGVVNLWSVIKLSPSTQGQAQANPTTGSMQSTVGQHAVTIQNFAFSPATLTIKVGDKVTWTNQDSIGHSATADDNSFDTGVLAQGQSGSMTFSKAGTYTYHCSVHPMMKATIIVQ